MEVPQTPLHTSRVLKEEKDAWEDVKVRCLSLNQHCFLYCSYVILGVDIYQKIPFLINISNINVLVMYVLFVSVSLDRMQLVVVYP